MALARAILMRAWRGLRAPWAAIVLLVALGVDAYRQVDWRWAETGSSLMERAAIWCRDRTGYIPPQTCILCYEQYPTTVEFARHPDGTIAFIDENTPDDSQFIAAEVNQTYRELGVWSTWLTYESYRFAFAPDVDKEARRPAVLLWTRTMQQWGYIDEPLISHSSSVGRSQILVNWASAANELAALTGLVLLARASWYTAFHWRSDRRRARNACPSCGYPREGLDAAAPCPECGAVASAGVETFRNGTFTSTIAADAGSGRRDEGESP